MANEATVQCGLIINVGKLSYQSQPQAFVADVSSAGASGPTPGKVLATANGTSVDLSKVTAPGGLGRVQNLDSTYTVNVGSYDASTARFTPWFDLLPGEVCPIRISKHFGHEYAGAGTGTASSDVTLMVRVDPIYEAAATASVLFEIFDL